MASQKRKRKSKRSSPAHFGGRATATGVNYESRVAALIGVHMLGGENCVLWEDLTGGDIIAVTLQAKQTVDDVVVTLRRSTRAFVSAKHRSKAIALTNASAAFVDTVAAFVAEFAMLAPESRIRSRFVWAVPSTAGAAVTTHLQSVLNAHRLEAGDSPLATFVSGRNRDQRSALEKLVAVINVSWMQDGGAKPREEELREFLRLTYVEVYDFGGGHHHERAAERELRTHVLSKPAQARRAWNKLEQIFSRADESGLTATAASLRSALASDGFDLALPADYARDIERLRKLTKRNLERLKEHTTLRFGNDAADVVHIDRIDEVTAFATAIRQTDLLLTGEPGCGKSGIVHAAASALQSSSVDVLLLLADEIFEPDAKRNGNVLGLDHPLDDVLANWPNGESGVLITDALDAVRDPEAQKLVRRLLREVREGQSNWKVAASVREFDLKHSRELRKAFPGNGVMTHSSSEFSGVSHFHLTGLTDDELNRLGQQRSEIVPFIDSARSNPKSSSLHKSPFYLRLAAELLTAGVTPTRLADWNSPAMLLRKFWENRVEGDGVEQRIAALNSICRHMVTERSMVLSTQEIALKAPELLAIADLRSRGILQSPSLLFGSQVGAEEIRFAHHLLHDYAIARAYIPTVGDRFCNFARRESLLPIFYRQSFVFALEEIWDADQTRKGFWACALELEGSATLHGLSRILAPIIAARRVEKFADL